MGQIKLLSSRRFASLFVTQFLGAFNDNVFRNSIVILVTFQSATVWGMAPEQVIALSAALFIAPFFLFSASAGQLSDKWPKTRMIRWVKAAEIAIMAVAAVGFATGELALQLFVLFAMGTQSAFFGPAKYAVLPELVERDDLVGANALVETGTFVAILLGTIVGGVVAANDTWNGTVLPALVVIVAVMGWVASTLIPHTPGANPDLPVAINPVAPTVEIFRTMRARRPVFLSILGISWFWFLGATLLSVLPVYSKGVLHGDENVVLLFLSLFCIGIAAGSLLCERMSDHKLELGLVPFGSIGMTLFVLDLWLVGDPWAGGAAPDTLLTLREFLAAPGSLRVCVDVALLSVFSGFYTVPLYTMIQQRSDPANRARVIAGNNILNAGFIVGSSLLLIGLYALDLSFPQIFAVLAFFNLVVAAYIYTVIPEFLLRFVAWILAGALYRMQVIGREHIPDEGPAVLVANHVSFIDWLLIASACKRPARFVMYHRYFDIPVAGFFFRDAKVIPISPAHEDSATLEAAYDRIAEELEAGEIVCLFPEGKITRDGELNPFRRGIERIVARTPVPVVPIALTGMWGSLFSREPSASIRRPFRRLWARLTVKVGPALAPGEVTAAALAERVAELGGWKAPAQAEA